MANKQLKRFYDDRYSREKYQTAIVPAKITNTPHDRYEAVTRYLPTYFSGGDILELGAGNGKIAASLINAGLAFSTYAITDLSEIRLRGADRVISDERVSYYVLDIEDTETIIQGRKYDAIIMLELIEHLIDPMAAMKNVRHLLRPGGFVFVTTPNIAKWTRRVKLLCGYFPSTAAKNEGLGENYDVEFFDLSHLHYFTFRSLEKMLIHFCGFSRVVKLPFWTSLRSIKIPSAIGHILAKMYPSLFSELTIIAWRD